MARFRLAGSVSFIEHLRFLRCTLSLGTLSQAMIDGKPEPRYEVRIKRKVERGLGNLPASVQDAMSYLLRDLKETGPVQKEWKSFSDLGKNKYHCHLSYKYVACWTWEKGTRSLEVYYVGSREGAPY
jgi:mRNA-degrading endonuclease RelE of RelBE toxin-antitoxin system